MRNQHLFIPYKVVLYVIIFNYKNFFSKNIFNFKISVYFNKISIREFINNVFICVKYLTAYKKIIGTRIVIIIYMYVINIYIIVYVDIR